MWSTAVVMFLVPATTFAWSGEGNGWPYGGYKNGRNGHSWGTGLANSSCAATCASSYWSTAQVTPAPSSWCSNGASVGDCLEADCSADPSVASSYSSKSSSLCSMYLSCSSTGTYTYSYESNSGQWSGFWGSAWPTGTVTVTGCPWYGDGFGFPFWRGLGYGNDFWANKSSGWDFTTTTTTAESSIVTEGATITSGASLALETAVSGDLETIRTLAVDNSATATGTSTTTEGSGATEWAVDHSVLIGGVLAGGLFAIGAL
ncbi:hypothetical protein HOO65_070161 [Ceratocystis lukuohia]|uniref:Uncharacterized protein n=2 Tax=Ceratocystis TaxID=5157 RepID=A0A2C5X2F0_9PEZI|nr:hypothetical protein CFIMG_004308RA [Ceratocystis fimbriata CBS 114723]